MSQFRRMWLVTTVIVSTVMTSSCASISPDALPQPGKTYRGGYDIVIAFENVLNLPERAKVVVDGTEVGVVTRVAVGPQQVNVTARIQSGVMVSSNVHAALQQATVLGDIYVTLERPTDQPTESPLAPGATIPLAQTTSPPQLEDTIAHLANFVSSGSIQRLQNTMIGLNRVAPQGVGAVRRLSSQVAADLEDLTNNIDTTDLLLDSVHQTTQILHDRLSSAEYWFSPRGMTGFDRATQLSDYLGAFFPSIGSIYTGGYWLVPLLTSAKDMLAAIRSAKWAFEDEVPAWRQLFTDTFLPQDRYPAINITSIVGPDGRELSGNVGDVLRILGATP
jgi:phospholipid/cholesterol/gamma-HCH transport system substrate-binding protein